MKILLRRLVIYTRRIIWAIIVAYMLGLHNFYKGEDKTPENIVTIEVVEEQDDGMPQGLA